MLSRMTNGTGFGFGGALGGAMDPVLRLHGEMNRLFESFFEDAPALATRPYARGWPALNTWEDGDAAWVEAELPGLAMDDVEVLVSGSDVTINGERRIAAPDNAAWHRRERSQGRFSRTLSLPWEIDADKVEARLQDGVLTVRLPKCETCKPKKVKVLTA
jgi:HSP20 family protein